MDLRCILFDINGTLIDILTDDHHPDIFRKIRNFLHYQGIHIHKNEIHDLYFEILKDQKAKSKEKYAEFDAAKVWEEILRLKETHHTKNLPHHIKESLPLILAQIYRAASFCRKLKLYPGVPEVIAALSKQYPLGIVTDAQSHYGVAELRSTGIAHYFSPIIVSGTYGFRKPDHRLFEMALKDLGVTPQQAIFVGNDMFHDVYGAKVVGMKAVFFHSNQGDALLREGVNPDYVIHHFQELINAIEHLKQK